MIVTQLVTQVLHDVVQRRVGKSLEQARPIRAEVFSNRSSTTRPTSARRLVPLSSPCISLEPPGSAGGGQQRDGDCFRRSAPRQGTGPGSAAGLRGEGCCFAFWTLTGQTWTVTSEQLEMISADPRVMHGQAVIAGTRVPVNGPSLIFQVRVIDCHRSRRSPGPRPHYQ